MKARTTHEVQSNIVLTMCCQSYLKKKIVQRRKASLTLSTKINPYIRHQTSMDYFSFSTAVSGLRLWVMVWSWRLALASKALKGIFQWWLGQHTVATDWFHSLGVCITSRCGMVAEIWAAKGAIWINTFNMLQLVEYRCITEKKFFTLSTVWKAQASKWSKSLWRDIYSYLRQHTETLSKEKSFILIPC